MRAGKSAASNSAGHESASSAAGGAEQKPERGTIFVEREDTPLRQELAAYADKLRAVEISKPPREAESMLPAAPAKLAGFSADTVARAITKQVGPAPLPIVQRTYTLKKARLRLRITDSARVSSLRQTFAQRLTTIGDAPTGHRQGRTVKGKTFLHAYLAGRSRSRASMFVGERFLVEADIEGAADADAAIRVLQAVPTGALRTR